MQVFFSDARGIVRIRCCLNPSGDDAAQKPWDFRSSRLNAYANVGADSIRPKLMELSGAVNGVSLDAVPHNRALAKIWGCGRMLSSRFGVRYRYRAGPGTDVWVQGSQRHWQFTEYPFDFLRKERYNRQRKTA